MPPAPIIFELFVLLSKYSPCRTNCNGDVREVVFVPIRCVYFPYHHGSALDAYMMLLPVYRQW